MTSVSDSVLQSMAGSIGGMGAMSITYPLVIASTRDSLTEKASGEKKSYNPAATILRIYSKEGLEGLYAGLSSSLFGIGVTNAVYYFAYSLSSETARKAGGGQLSVKDSIIAGMIAGSATTVITNPLWVVQTHQSTYTHLNPNSPPPSIPGAIKDLYKKGGIPAFFRGLKAALVLVVNPVLQYTAFEQLKNLLLARRRIGGQPGALSNTDIFFLGALAKLFATSLSYPLVLLKSRLQSASHHYPSITSALIDIVRKEGLGGLYRGIGGKLLQSVLTASLLFLGHERVLMGLRKALATK